MSNMTKGQIEAQISEAIIKFEKDYMGRGSMETKTYILKDTERRLTKEQGGMKLTKELKEKLIEKAKPLLDAMIKDLTKTEIVDIPSSFNVDTSERIKIFTLDRNLEKISRS